MDTSTIVKEQLTYDVCVKDRKYFQHSEKSRVESFIYILFATE